MRACGFVAPAPVFARRAPRVPHARARRAPAARLWPFGAPGESVDVAQRRDAGVPAVRVRELRKSFVVRTRSGPRRRRAVREVKAVDGVSFDVAPGSVFGLLGPNGCGKTTTLRCVSTLSRADSGRVEIYGVDTAKNGVLARQMLSLVSQSAGLDKVLTGREHLQLFAGLAHVPRARVRRSVEEVVDALGLGEVIDRQVGAYSGGMARRLDLAIGLLSRPPLLILDEPTVGLDVASRAVIWDIVRRLRENGASVLLTSHYLEEVDVLADAVAVMDRGVVLAAGGTAQLKAALGGDRVTVRIDEFTDAGVADAAAHALRGEAVVQSVLVNRVRGNALEVVVKSEDGAAARIMGALARAGHTSLFGFAQAKPSLDDVYVAATGKRLEDADREGRVGRNEKSQRQEAMF